MATQPVSKDVAEPLASYTPWRLAGDLVHFPGIVAADLSATRTVTGHADPPVYTRRWRTQAARSTTS